MQKSSGDEVEKRQIQDELAKLRQENDKWRTLVLKGMLVVECIFLGALDRRIIVTIINILI